jgi:hypothetical protein
VPENSDYSQPISSRKLKEALTEATIILGRAAQDSMFHDLELNGITFKDRSYTLEEIQSALRKIFGNDGTVLLMQGLQKAMK